MTQNLINFAIRSVTIYYGTAFVLAALLTTYGFYQVEKSRDEKSLSKWSRLSATYTGEYIGSSKYKTEKRRWYNRGGCQISSSCGKDPESVGHLEYMNDRYDDVYTRVQRQLAKSDH